MSEIEKTILILFAIFLPVKIFSAYRENQSLSLLITPLVTITVISIPLHWILGGNSSIYTTILLTGLILALVADIFMTEADDSEEKFQLGIIFFLLSHGMYIAAFLKGFQFHSLHIAFIIVIFAVLGILYMNFRDSLNDPVMKIGVPLYMLVLSAMMFVAIGNIGNNPDRGDLLIAAGSVMFWFSDIIIGINAFWRKIPKHLCFVWSLYAPGQLLIALSVLYQ